MGGDESFAAAFVEGYLNSKAYALSQLFSRYAILALFAFEKSTNPDNSEYKQRMLKELKGVATLPDHGTFNLAVLNQITQILQEVNWNDHSQFSSAVQKVRELRGKNNQ